MKSAWSVGFLAVLLWSGWVGAGELGAGARYTAVVKPALPLSVQVFEFRRGHAGWRLVASVGRGVKGLETIPDMAALIPPHWGKPRAAINGDYFEYRTEPRFLGTLQGLCIIEGELVSGPAGWAFCLGRDGQPRIQAVQSRFQMIWPDGKTTPFGLNCSPADYRSEVKTADIVLFTPRFGPSTGTTGARELLLVSSGEGPWLPLRAGQTFSARVGSVNPVGDTAIPSNGLVLSISKKAEVAIPAAKVGDLLRFQAGFNVDLSDVETAVSGDPLLLEGGRIVPKSPEPGTAQAQRAPRTAIGFNATNIFGVVVDGRQPGFSVGLNHYEWAEFLRELGCTDAVNLDGGGSSTFWLDGRIMNSPSGGQPRPVGNGLILLERNPSDSRAP